MKIKLDSLIISSYDRTNKNHLNFKLGLYNDEMFINYFGQFFLKKIDEIFDNSNELEVNKAYLIEDNENVVGMIRIFKKSFNGVIELQYLVSKNYRNSGYGTKILKEVSNYLISTNDVTCIKLDIDKTNKGSIVCATKVGYNKEDNYYSVKKSL